MTDQKEFARVAEILEDIHFDKPNYELILAVDKENANGRLYLQIQHLRKDAYTGEMGVGDGRKQYLSKHMTRSEIVRIAFALFDGYRHHETREAFHYKGRAIFGPHIAVDALHEIAEELDFRPPRVST